MQIRHTLHRPVLLYTVIMPGSPSKALQKATMMLSGFQQEMVLLTNNNTMLKVVHNVVLLELSPHVVGEAFYNGETEAELRRIKRADFKFKKDSDRDNCMEMIEEIRRETLYSHCPKMCTSVCKSRGLDDITHKCMS